MLYFLHGHSLLFLALARLVSSQIGSIDAVKTSEDEYGHPQCIFSNFTSNALGVANFSVHSIADLQPLTWTVALSGASGASDDLSHSLYDQNYILGAPRSAGLLNLTSLYGCGLFFEGMTPLLSFPGKDRETSVGTCKDVLTTECVDDILNQAQAEGLKLQKTQKDQKNSNLSAICTTLQQRIVQSPPASCNIATTSDWENILARGRSTRQSFNTSFSNELDLTGPSVAHAVNEGSCHPTTGDDYEVSLVASYRRVSEPIYDRVMPFLSGVTPVMTAFFDFSTQNSTSATPDVQITCLKALTSTAGMTVEIDDGPHKSSIATITYSKSDHIVWLLSFLGLLYQLLV